MDVLDHRPVVVELLEPLAMRRERFKIGVDTRSHPAGTDWPERRGGREGISGLRVGAHQTRSVALLQHSTSKRAGYRRFPLPAFFRGWRRGTRANYVADVINRSSTSYLSAAEAGSCHRLGRLPSKAAGATYDAERCRLGVRRPSASGPTRSSI